MILALHERETKQDALLKFALYDFAPVDIQQIWYKTQNAKHVAGHGCSTHPRGEPGMERE